MSEVDVERGLDIEQEPVYEQRFAQRVEALRGYAAYDRGEDVDLGVIREQLGPEIAPITEARSAAQNDSLARIYQEHEPGSTEVDIVDYTKAKRERRDLLFDATEEVLVRVFDGVRTNEGIVRGFTEDVIEISWPPVFIGEMLKRMEDKGWLEREWTEGTLVINRDYPVIK